jgi:hypothetical protein
MGRAMFEYSTDLLAVLLKSGWYSGRQIDISGWLKEFDENKYEVSQVAIDLLSTFGGLVFPNLPANRPKYSNPVTIDPMLALDGRPVLWEQKIGESLTPLGERKDQSVIYVSPTGLIFGHYLQYFMCYGKTLEESFTGLILYNKQFDNFELS